MFKGCYKLKPGHFIEIRCDQTPLTVQCSRYWKPTIQLRDLAENEWVELLNEQLQATINRHMVADVPVSSFLSGGLDSSLISVMASRHTAKLSTFTIGTRQEDKNIEKMPEDEMYAARLAKQFSFDHTSIVIEPGIIDDLPKMVRILDEPIGDPAAINTYLICKQARERGVKVLLSGMGADEIFLGYRRQQALLYTARYQKLPGILRKPIGYGAGLLPVRINNRGIKSFRWLKRFMSFADLDIEKAYRRSYSYYDDEEYGELFKQDYSAEIEKLNRQHHAYFYEAAGADLENRMY